VSGAKFLLDTNILIGLENGTEAALTLVEKSGVSPNNSAVSQISRIELLSFHALTADQEQRLTAMLSAVSIIPLDAAVEREAIALRRKHRLKLPDAIIAGSARAHGLTLLTLDEKLAALVTST
jgi:predicted nucleic acid-binding protein